jgi:tetraacyldisaccharide 4'-kinase
VLLGAKEAGDEAFLLAQSLPEVPVIVGKERRKTGALAWERFQPDVIVMDDGLQFWQLYRDLNIILLNACDPFDNGYTLPRGLLREPISHLRRGGIVVLTNAKRAGIEKVQETIAKAQHYAPSMPLFEANLTPIYLTSFPQKERIGLEWLHGRRVVAFSAIGNPEAFENLLESLGSVLVARHRLRDHTEMTPAEIEQIVTEAQSLNAEGVVTTEKDAVKLPILAEEMPFLVLHVETTVGDSNGFVERLLHLSGLGDVLY